jgi:hypothetical protein
VVQANKTKKPETAHVRITVKGDPLQPKKGRTFYIIPVIAVYGGGVRQHIDYNFYYVT